MGGNFHRFKRVPIAEEVLSFFTKTSIRVRSFPLSFNQVPASLAKIVMMTRKKHWRPPAPGFSSSHQPLVIELVRSCAFLLLESGCFA